MSRGLENVSGATVLGDGRIALILDAHQIIYSKEERGMIEAV
jgi:chemotaxis protein histidine kinase CheA